MAKRIKLYIYALFVLTILGLSACATLPAPIQTESALYYLPEQDDQLLSRYAPVFLTEESQIDSNRIGTIRATSHDTVFIDPESPTLYVEQREFSTAKGHYTNLIYRVHFQEVPSTFSPYYLGAGKNVGLFVLVTLDENQRPLLYTTVNSCGCYLAFTPTSLLPNQALPADWSFERQSIYGESLPSILNVTDTPADQQRIQIRLRPGTHRVMDLWLETAAATPAPAVTTPLRRLADLQRLPLEGNQTTSFYETSGSRTGHVKGSYKFRERLLMSWWALDWNIGQDKMLGRDKNDGPTFNTSLKPWAWDDSDMRDFATFLNYWGWNL
jgi:hypothetical protein